MMPSEPSRSTESPQQPRWVDRRWGRVLVGSDGHWIRVELGVTHHEMPEIRVLDAPKPCSRCRQPCVFATPRGRALHPGCTGWLDECAPDVHAAVMAYVWHVLQITDIGEH